MKKGLRSMLSLAVCAFSLTSCLSKTTYDEFHASAVEASKKEVTFVKLAFSGNYVQSGVTVSLDGITYEFTEKDGWKATAEIGTVQATMTASLYLDRAQNVQDDSESTFYKGSGFKVEKGSYVREYNEYGYLTHASNTNFDFKINWTKK